VCQSNDCMLHCSVTRTSGALQGHSSKQKFEGGLSFENVPTMGLYPSKTFAAQCASSPSPLYRTEEGTWRGHSEMKTLVSFLALFVSPCLSTAFSQSMSICKPDYSDIFWSKSKYLDTIYSRCNNALIGSSVAVPAGQSKKL